MNGVNIEYCWCSEVKMTVFLSYVFAVLACSSCHMNESNMFNPEQQPPNSGEEARSCFNSLNKPQPSKPLCDTVTACFHPSHHLGTKLGGTKEGERERRQEN